MVAQHPEAFVRGGDGAPCILLFVGASGKSAQIPLYVWLPDAMAGPTPVSALIHAATMVTAGVYMIARLNFLYELAPVAHGRGRRSSAPRRRSSRRRSGFAQRDIKKVLAYSTVSQLGYMFIAVGVGAYSAGVFHLMTHAFFKACLFLGAGSRDPRDARRAGHVQDGRARASACRSRAATFLVASLAIAGLPAAGRLLLQGRDPVERRSTRTSGRSGCGAFCGSSDSPTAGMTAFYMFRAVFLTFFGEASVSAEAKHHLHESPP